MYLMAHINVLCGFPWLHEQHLVGTQTRSVVIYFANILAHLKLMIKVLRTYIQYL